LDKTYESYHVKPFEEKDISNLSVSGCFGRTRKELKGKIEKIKKIAGISNMYLSKEKDSLFLCGFSKTDCNTNQAEIWIEPSESDVDLSNTISFLLYEGFHHRKLHKLSVCVKEGDSGFIQALTAAKWTQEGILADHFYEHGHYGNGILYAMIETDFYHYSISLIPFLNGYLIMHTTNRAVIEISIIKEKEQVPGYIDETCGYKDKISEKNKIIQPQNNSLIYMSEKAYPYLIHASNQLFEYTIGLRTSFDLTFEYSDATDFQKQVWEATIQIPYGQTRTYAEIANRLRPNEKNSDLSLLSRAVGSALGKNPIMIAIPCHRVIGKDGKLKGFAGGLEVKDHLLSQEMLLRQ